MNKIQKRVLVTFLLLTVIQLILIYMFQASNGLRCLEFAGSFFLFIVAVMVKKEYQEQKILVLAFLFSAMGDFFMVFLPVIRKGTDGSLPGIASFILSYVFVILAFHRNFRLKLLDITLSLPFIGVIVYFFATMNQYIKGLFMIAALIFSVIITIMAWTMVTALIRGYFTKPVAMIVAMAGIMIFASDIAVAYELFHPAFSDPPVWIALFIRATYVPAWTLLLVVVCQKEIRLERS